MKILVILAHSYIPQYSGGVESSTNELIPELIRRGHDARLLCQFLPEGLIGLKMRLARRLSGKPYGRDNGLGYPVYRAWDVLKVVEAAIDDLKPDAVLVQNWAPVEVGKAVERTGRTPVIYLRNVEFVDLDGDLRDLRNSLFLTNSQFTADRYRGAFGIDSTVIPPMFRPESYIGPRRPANVTFINPHPVKGGPLAFDLAAACPEIPFAFYRSWTLDDAQEAFLSERLSTVGNVTLHPRTKDMKAVYSQAKVVLMPSQWEEAWGRVASEAQFNGIPVLASSVGGLPESVGPGGILMPPNAPVAEWAAALRRLWFDEAAYNAASAAALDYSRRPEIDAGRQIDSLLEVLKTAAASRG